MRNCYALCVANPGPQTLELATLSEYLRHDQSFFSKVSFFNMQTLERFQPRGGGGAALRVYPGHQIVSRRGRRVRTAIRAVYDYLFKASLFAMPFWYVFYLRLFLRIKNILQKESPNLVMLAVDTSYYSSSIWVKACKSLKIPCVLFPFGLADQESLAKDRITNWAYGTRVPDNFLLLSFFSRLGCIYKGERLSILPAGQALARLILGFITPEPWIYNSSAADLVLCESEFTWQQLKGEFAGRIPAYYRITGTIRHDFIFRAKMDLIPGRRKLLEAYGFESTKPLLLGAMTVDKFSAFGHQSEFSSFDEMIEFWLEVISSRPEHQILLSIHPSEDPGRFRKYETQRIRIASEPFHQLIPYVDLLVNDCSATSRIAAAASVPVLDYDLYRFNLNFNKLQDLYLYVDSKKDFVGSWNRIWTSDFQLQDFLGSQRLGEDFYGRIDGKAAIRIQEALKILL